MEKDDLMDYRRQRLVNLIVESRESRRDFCKRYDLSYLSIAGYINTHFSSVMARKLEVKLNLPTYYFDEGGPGFSLPDIRHKLLPPIDARQDSPILLSVSDDSGYTFPVGKFRPIRGIVQGEDDGTVTLHAPARGEDEILSPIYSEQAYAIQIRGDGLRPRLRSGDYAVADPANPPEPGGDVIVTMKNGRLYIEELLWQRPGELSLMPFVGGKAHTLMMDNVDSIHRISAIITHGSAIVRARASFPS